MKTEKKFKPVRLTRRMIIAAAAQDTARKLRPTLCALSALCGRKNHSKNHASRVK